MNKLIVAMADPSLTESVVHAGRAAGAPGYTVIPARGGGHSHRKTFFGFELNTQTDVILFILDDSLISAVKEAISTLEPIPDAHPVISFILPMLMLTGVNHPMLAIAEH